MEEVRPMDKWEKWEKENKINLPRKQIMDKYPTSSIIPESEVWTYFDKFTVYSSLTTNPGMGKEFLRYHQIVFRSFDVLMYESNITGVGQNVDKLNQEGIQRFKTIIKLAAEAFDISPILEKENRSIRVCPECRSANY